MPLRPIFIIVYAICKCLYKTGINGNIWGAKMVYNRMKGNNETEETAHADLSL
jgi:hypothetical protein